MSQRQIVEYMGRNVRWDRKDAGMNQKELAERAGLNIRTIRRLEQGLSAPSLEDLEKIAIALGDTLYSLFFHATQHEKYDSAKTAKDDEIRKIEYMLRRHTAGELKILRAIIRDVFELQRLKNR